MWGLQVTPVFLVLVADLLHEAEGVKVLAILLCPVVIAVGPAIEVDQQRPALPLALRLDVLWETQALS